MRQRHFAACDSKTARLSANRLNIYKRFSDRNLSLQKVLRISPVQRVDKIITKKE